MVHKRLICKKETYDLIMQECVQEFYRQNPSFRGDVRMTHDLILRRMARYYLKG